MVAFFSPAIPYVVPTTMIDVIKHLGLTSGLKLCLDAGDIASVATATPDKWLDTSGNGYDFFRGSGTGSDAADPTFGGTVGRQSSGEYWSFDGGDWLTYDTTNETWMQNLHKDSALLSAVAWFRPAATATGTSANIFGTNNGQLSTIGCQWAYGAVKDGDIGFGPSNGSGGDAGTMSTTAVLNAAAWNFIAMSLNEGTGAGVLQINATQESPTLTYSSPSASNASFTMRIGDAGNAFRPLLSGDRLANLAIWEGVALSSAQLLSIYNATKAKFGL